ncbi:MAG: DUF4198 domain-containing protein [Candidatus Eisenbacteria bacterium]
MRQLKLLFMLVLIIGLAERAAAHEHWVDVSSFYPDRGETLEVYICSGHHFPEGDHVLEDKVVEGLRMWTAGKTPRLIESVVDEKFRTAEIALEHEGVHIVGFTLKRPKAKKPSFEAKAIVVANPLKDDPGRYGLGEGLELVPLEAVSAIRPGDTLSVSLALDGNSIGAPLQVIPENGRTHYARTDVDAPAPIPIRTCGRYLVMAQVEGRGASLVFEVREQDATEDMGKEIP